MKEEKEDQDKKCLEKFIESELENRKKGRD